MTTIADVARRMAEKCPYCVAGICVLSHRPIPREDVESARALAQERDWKEIRA